MRAVSNLVKGDRTERPLDRSRKFPLFLTLIALILGGSTSSASSSVIGNNFTWTAHDVSRPWTAIVSSNDGVHLAGIAGGIFTSNDSGFSWTKRDSTHNWNSIASSSDGTKLIASSDQIYTSTDAGITWTPRDAPRSWQGVASSADGTHLFALEGSMFGGNLYASIDSGATWSIRYAGSSWIKIISSPDGMHLAAVSHQGQISTSADSGKTWTANGPTAVWTSIASSSDGVHLAATATDGYRNPGKIYTSADSGVTWTPRNGVRGWSSVASSSDGKRLIAGVGGQNSYISMDYGVTWTLTGPVLTDPVVASSSDGSHLYAADWIGQVYTAISNGSSPKSCAASISATPIKLSAPLSKSATFKNWSPRGPIANWTQVSLSTDGKHLVATRTDGPICTSDDSGVSWTERDTGSDFGEVVSSSNGKRVVALGRGGSSGVAYTSDDFGATWTAGDPQHFGGLLGVQTSDDGLHLVAVASSAKVATSSDAGVTWIFHNIGLNNCVSVAISGDGTHLFASTNDGHLYISSDFGSTWTARDLNPISRIVQISSSTDGSHLLAIGWVGTGQRQLYTSDNSGLSWKSREPVRLWVDVASANDGKRLAAADFGFTSGGGGIYISNDFGVTWSRQDPPAMGGKTADWAWNSIDMSSDGSHLVAVVVTGIGAGIYSANSVNSTTSNIVKTTSGGTRKSSTKAITCVKGKLVKRLIGTSPICPAGFIKK